MNVKVENMNSQTLQYQYIMIKIKFEFIIKLWKISMFIYLKATCKDFEHHGIKLDLTIN